MVQYVATEYGVVCLSGLSVRQRAQAMASIAHPDFREELERYARDEMKPVSYTHLDVYKRQPGEPWKNPLCRGGPPCRPSGRWQETESCLHLPLAEGLQDLEPYGPALFRMELGAHYVSPAHRRRQLRAVLRGGNDVFLTVDVYKRQL